MEYMEQYVAIEFHAQAKADEFFVNIFSAIIIS